MTAICDVEILIQWRDFDGAIFGEDRVTLSDFFARYPGYASENRDLVIEELETQGKHVWRQEYGIKAHLIRTIS